MITRPQKSKSLLIFIAVLLAANIIGLAYFFMNKPAHKKMDYAAERKNSMLVYLKNEIGFSETQLVNYDSLMEQHSREMKPLFEQLKKEKEARLKYIAQHNFSDAAIDSALNRSNTQQKQVEINMLHYIKEVRMLCTEQQIPKFDSSIHKIFGRRGGDRKKTD